MSILIKGIEMPTPEQGVRTINIYADGVVTNYAEATIAQAIPVPPHGRLIDADALYKDGWVLQKQVMRMGGYAIHEMPLTCPSLPTIIEAEEGE